MTTVSLSCCAVSRAPSHGTMHGAFLFLSLASHSRSQKQPLANLKSEEVRLEVDRDGAVTLFVLTEVGGMGGWARKRTAVRRVDAWRKGFCCKAGLATRVVSTRWLASAKESDIKNGSAPR